VEQHPFDEPHGEGWLIREYASLEGLQPLPELDTPYRPFPVQWLSVIDDAPGWEDAWDIIDLSCVNDDEQASDSFFEDFNRYRGTKVGDFRLRYNTVWESKSLFFRLGQKKSKLDVGG
jgi:hypothetical protein